VRAQGVPPPSCAISPIDGSVVNCTGNQSAGIDLADGTGPFRTLNAFDLTTNIGPAAGDYGVAFTSDGDVTLNFSTGPFSIITTGDNADGIFALSSGGAVTITSIGDIATSGEEAFGIRAFAPGDIVITSASNISTTGVMGVGIFAETTGATIVTSSGNILTFGERAAGIAAAGEGGTAVISTGNITTYGDDAPGITVLSDGDVAVASSGNITTTGDDSDGINAISANGMAAVVNSGDISATGSGSAGIYVAGYSGTLVMNTGSVTGGPCCAGVMMTSANTNTLLNWGSITADGAGDAIDASGLNNVVENFGTVTGNVLLFGATSQFINHAGALFNTGANVDAGFVSNDGTIAPGGRGTIETTALGDSLTQSAPGVLAIDVGGSTSDLIEVSAFADLAGKVAVTLTSLPTTAVQSYLILQALSGVTDNGLGLIASPALHATLTFPNATDLVLGIAVDFTVDGLNPNQRAIATNLDQILFAGVGTLGPALLGLLNVGSIDDFKNALNQLSPEIYSDAEIAALYSSLAFSNSLLSCKVNGTDTASIIREGQCLWAGASARFIDSGTTSDQIGFNEVAGLFTAGAQVALDDVWRLGAAAGYQSSTLQTATGAQSEGSLAQAGVSLKYNPGPLLLAGALTGGGAWYDTTRPMAFGGFTGLAEGDQDLGIFSASLRAAYVLGTPHLYFKTILDANLTHLELGGFTESGGNGAALTVDGAGHTVFSLAPTLEAGTEWWVGNGTLVRPLIRAGAIWYEGADFATTASFAGAPVGVTPFTINTDIDEVMGLIGAGVEVINGGDAVLRLSYDGQLGADTQIHSVGIKGSSKF
jgi:hypothetical protein